MNVTVGERPTGYCGCGHRRAVVMSRYETILVERTTMSMADGIHADQLDTTIVPGWFDTCCRLALRHVARARDIHIG